MRRRASSKQSGLLKQVTFFSEKPHLTGLGGHPSHRAIAINLTSENVDPLSQYDPYITLYNIGDYSLNPCALEHPCDKPEQPPSKARNKPAEEGLRRGIGFRDYRESIG